MQNILYSVRGIFFLFFFAALKWCLGVVSAHNTYDLMHVLSFCVLVHYFRIEHVITRSLSDQVHYLYRTRTPIKHNKTQTKAFQSKLSLNSHQEVDTGVGWGLKK